MTALSVNTFSLYILYFHLIFIKAKMRSQKTDLILPRLVRLFSTTSTSRSVLYLCVDWRTRVSSGLEIHVFLCHVTTLTSQTRECGSPIHTHSRKTFNATNVWKKKFFELLRKNHDVCCILRIFLLIMFTQSFLTCLSFYLFVCVCDCMGTYIHVHRVRVCAFDSRILIKSEKECQQYINIKVEWTETSGISS